MAEAYKCDKCSNLLEGSPAGYLQVSSGGTYALCNNCVDEILDANLPDVAEEKREKARQELARQEAEVVKEAV